MMGNVSSVKHPIARSLEIKIRMGLSNSRE